MNFGSRPVRRLGQLMIILICSTGGAAETGYSNIFWQPGTGQHAILPGLSHDISVGKFSGSVSGFSVTGDYSGSGTTLSATYRYGLSEQVSIGAGTGFSTQKYKTTITMLGSSTDSTTAYEGLGDLQLYFSGRNTFSLGAFYYGVNTALSPGDSTYDSSADKGNVMSGGISATPYLGIHWALNSSFYLGARATYSVRGERKSKYSNPDSEVKTTGGNTLTVGAFIEFPEVSWHPTIEVFHSKPDKSISTTGGTRTESQGAGFLSLMASADIEISPGFEILPGVGYSTLTDKSSGGLTYDTIGLYMLAFGARFVF